MRSIPLIWHSAEYSNNSAVLWPVLNSIIDSAKDNGKDCVLTLSQTCYTIVESFMST